MRLLNTPDDEEFNMDIVVREWVDILPEYEFRGFVYQRKLNAVTQVVFFLYLMEW